MKKVTITFEYDETHDGELTSEDYDNIIEALLPYGSDIEVTEE